MSHIPKLDTDRLITNDALQGFFSFLHKHHTETHTSTSTELPGFENTVIVTNTPHLLRGNCPYAAASTKLHHEIVSNYPY